MGIAAACRGLARKMGVLAAAEAWHFGWRASWEVRSGVAARL